MFAKIYSSFVANSNKTLKNTVNVSKLISKLKDENLISKLSKFKKYSEVNLWDLGKKATSQIKVGAILTIICKDVIYSGQIVGIVNDENGDIGNAVGWARQFKNPWSNVILLKNVKQSVRSEKVFNFIKEHEKYPYEIFKNFLRFDGKEEKIFSKLIGSSPASAKFRIVDEHTLIQSKAKNNKPKLKLPSWLKEIVDYVNRLKTDKVHEERAHESLIEKFFESLGYEKYNDIKFRIGRIDISISIENKPLIVIEVKKYWNLDVKKDIDAVEQAYKYALNNGARFVIISNGDYYAIFDRDCGRTYTDNLKGEFVLTDLSKDDIRLIDFLKKDKILSNPK